MRNPENITALLEDSIDLMGLIFYEKSARNVPNSAAKEIVAASLDKVSRVGVFVNESIEVVIQKKAKFQLEYIQLHGSESPDYCYDLLAKSARTFGCGDDMKLIKVFSIGDSFDFSVTAPYAPYVHYFLFDTKGKHPGGNGITFDWSLLNEYKGDIPFLLSGGIGVDAATAINALEHPKLAGIDINSKFEIAPALKDVEKLKQFYKQINNGSGRDAKFCV